MIKLKEVLEATTHGAFSDALLPLAHPDTFLQRGALLQQQVPAAVRIPGSDAGSAAGERKEDFHSFSFNGVSINPLYFSGDAAQHQMSGRARGRLKRGDGGAVGGR